MNDFHYQVPKPFLKECSTMTMKRGVHCMLTRNTYLSDSNRSKGLVREPNGISTEKALAGKRANRSVFELDASPGQWLSTLNQIFIRPNEWHTTPD